MKIKTVLLDEDYVLVRYNKQEAEPNNGLKESIEIEAVYLDDEEIQCEDRLDEIEELLWVLECGA